MSIDLDELERETAQKMFEIATAAGVVVTEDELRKAIKGMPAETLRALPRTYAADIADLRAAGIDPNDPSNFEPIMTLDEAIERGLSERDAA